MSQEILITLKGREGIRKWKTTEEVVQDHADHASAMVVTEEALAKTTEKKEASAATDQEGRSERTTVKEDRSAETDLA